MPPRHFGQRHAIAIAFLDGPNLLVIRPSPTATSVRDKQNLNAKGIIALVHKDIR